ncbi:MAG: hypothetical protein HYX80_03680 [Chloroflexi bacterium]|nr:hypothetical protein [Chloroflexota bacterium]
MAIAREQIIRALEEAVRDNPSVFALWLEGADAYGAVDRYSDIDFWLDVRDGDENRILDEIEKSLSQLAELDFVYQPKHAHPLIKHRILHLIDTPETLLIDVCIQSHSRDYEFVKGDYEQPKIIFNRGGIKFREFDEAAFQKELEDRVYHLKMAFAQQSRVLAKIERGDFLEALMYYSKWTLEPLVELLRIKYCPQKRGFHFKHSSRDLPGEVVEQLEYLSRVQSVEDIAEKIKMASRLFDETLKEVEKELAAKGKG